MALQLHPTLETYFAACFADDAVVHDEGRDIVGRAAIHAWAVESGRQYRFHAQPLSVADAADRTVVTAHLTGDFPGSPVDLRYRFKMADGLILALDIA